MRISLDTIGIEFTFDVNIENPSKRVGFYRELYGHKNYSNFGKYLYIKDGILSNMKYLKPTRSTVIVSKKDAREVRIFLKKSKVIFDEKIVILDHKEAKKLGLDFPNNWKKIYEDLKGNENLVFSVDF